MARDDSTPQHLPPGLTATVRVVQALLGRVVAAAEGDALYETVEQVRLHMVAFREAAKPEDRQRALDQAHQRLEPLSVEQKTALARAYTLYLELVNVCENAYRTHRLREHRPATGDPTTARLTFVLTAHPTESRSPANIRVLRRIQDHLVERLEEDRDIDEREVEHLLHVAWRVGTHPAEKPSVEDEANHLFSLLTDPILAEMTALAEAGHEIRLRAWVGGDKDGHPGVGPAQTVASLERSRTRLSAFVTAALLPSVAEDVGLVGGATDVLANLEAALTGLAKIEDDDGARVANLHDAVERFQSAWQDRTGVPHPWVARLSTLLEIFPALVVPLELREEAGRFGSDEPIAAMMRRLADVAGGGSVHHYARAVVVSMTRQPEDLLDAQQTVTDAFGGPILPVIPLFELPDVLQRAPEILDGAWADDAFRGAVETRGHLEVMLGYSDTAKRMGVLASRVALHDAMRAIGEWCAARDVAPLFFHGHGGSVGRGGGRIEDLAATWPPAARAPYKYTVQGEMVERTFATPEILRSLVRKVAAVQADPPGYRGVGALARELAEASGAAFAATVADDDFRALLGRATPYARLQALTIGSRPASREGGGLEELRAIPWVLCWTQTRLLLHSWLGAGAAWRVLRERPDIEALLAEARDEDPLFRSYARLLSFTLAKTEPDLWERYRRALAPDVAEDLVAALDADLAAAHELALAVTGADSLLPDRPWLEESIRYRAPMIHPLNLLQIELLAKDEWSPAEVRLFRETVTGIAAGMLTTG